MVLLLEPAVLGLGERLEVAVGVGRNDRSMECPVEGEVVVGRHGSSMQCPVVGEVGVGRQGRSKPCPVVGEEAGEVGLQVLVGETGLCVQLSLCYYSLMR